jgi:hypothetical protein
MDKGHERNDSIWTALLNTILLVENVEKLSTKRWSSLWCLLYDSIEFPVVTELQVE